MVGKCAMVGLMEVVSCVFGRCFGVGFVGFDDGRKEWVVEKLEVIGWRCEVGVGVGD